jgi:hypothetical protein
MVYGVTFDLKVMSKHSISFFYGSVGYIRDLNKLKLDSFITVFIRIGLM